MNTVLEKFLCQDVIILAHKKIVQNYDSLFKADAPLVDFIYLNLNY